MRALQKPIKILLYRDQGTGGKVLVAREWESVIREGPYVIVEVSEGVYVPFPLPKWASYVAMDDNGSVHAFERKPLKNDHGFWDESDDDFSVKELLVIQDPARFEWTEAVGEVPYDSTLVESAETEEESEARSDASGVS